MSNQAKQVEEAVARAERAEAELAAMKEQKVSSAGKSVTSRSEEHLAQGEEVLRQDSMMAHLLDSLAAGKDIGHYGRLVFVMVARHFLTRDELLTRLTGDPDFAESEAETMLAQVEERGYNPPRRDRVMEWQAQQEFPILPSPEDPDCGNVYRTLKFPDEVYHHIEHYQEQKHSVA